MAPINRLALPIETQARYQIEVADRARGLGEIGQLGGKIEDRTGRQRRMIRGARADLQADDGGWDIRTGVMTDRPLCGLASLCGLLVSS